ARVYRYLRDGGGRERRSLLAQQAASGELTGPMPFAMSFEEGELKLVLGPDAEAELAKPGEHKLRCELSVPESGFNLAIGARDGLLAIGAGKLQARVSEQWWRNTGRALSAAARLYEFRQAGAEKLYSELRYNLPPEARDQALKGYDEEARRLRERGQFSAVYR